MPSPATTMPTASFPALRVVRATRVYPYDDPAMSGAHGPISDTPIVYVGLLEYRVWRGIRTLRVGIFASPLLRAFQRL